MNKLPFYAVLVLASACGFSTADARPFREDVMLVDNSPDEYYERQDRYEREDHYRRDDIYEREDRYSDDREWRDRPTRYIERTRTIYVIVNDRPVRRVVYVNPGGGYYRVIGGQRVLVRDRYFTSYPSRYFYPDGRRRIGIRFPY